LAKSAYHAGGEASNQESGDGIAEDIEEAEESREEQR
jgi:hypothetical protein